MHSLEVVEDRLTGSPDADDLPLVADDGAARPAPPGTAPVIDLPAGCGDDRPTS